MFEENFERIIDYLIPQIMRNKTKIAYKDLVNRPLPAYFWDFFDVIFNPDVAEFVQIGALTLDNSSLMQAQDSSERRRSTLEFSTEELTDLITAGLDTRLKFILTPAEAVADLIFDYNTADEIRSQQIISIIERVDKLLENWDPMIRHSVKIIVPYLSSKGNEEISKRDFIRILQNAIEKESSFKSLSWVETSLDNLDSLLQLDPELEKLEEMDMHEPVLGVLKSRGLDFWVPAIDIEHDLRGDFLNLDQIKDSLMRLNTYIDNKLLGPHRSDDLGNVEEEIEDFTDFLTAETEGIDETEDTEEVEDFDEKDEVGETDVFQHADMVDSMDDPEGIIKFDANDELDESNVMEEFEKMEEEDDTVNLEGINIIEGIDGLEDEIKLDRIEDITEFEETEDTKQTKKTKKKK